MADNDRRRMQLFQSYAILTFDKKKQKESNFEEQRRDLLKSLMGEKKEISDLIVYTDEGLQAAKALKDEGLWKDKHLFYPVNVANYNLLVQQKMRIHGLKNIQLRPINLPPENESDLGSGASLSNKVEELSEVKRLQEKNIDALQKWLSLRELNKTLMERLSESARLQDSMADEIGLRDVEEEKLRKRTDELINKLQLMTDERDKLKAQVEELLTNEEKFKLILQCIEDKVSTAQHEADNLSRRVAKLEEKMHDVTGKTCKENEKQAS